MSFKLKLCNVDVRKMAQTQSSDVLYLSIFRITLAILSISFFVFFFQDKVVEFTSTQASIIKLHLSELIHQHTDALEAEKTWMVLYTLGLHTNYSQSTPLTADTDFRWLQLKPELSFPPPRQPTLASMDQLSMIRQKVVDGNVSVIDVFVFYKDLVNQFIKYWAEDCSGLSVELINRSIMSDYFRTNTMCSIGAERDLVLILSSATNTLQQNYFLKTNARSQITFQENLLRSTIFFSSPNLQLFYEDLLENDIQFTEDLKFLRSFRAPFIYSSTNITDISHFDPTLYSQACDIVMAKIDEGDELQQVPDSTQLIVGFVIAAVGMLIQLVLTISLSWTAIPMLKDLRKKKNLNKSLTPKKYSPQLTSSPKHTSPKVT